MSFIKRSTKWLWPVDIGLLVLAWGVGAAFGIFAFHSPSTKIINVLRPTISHTASYKEVVANFTGKPYVNGQLSELPGFVCQGWTNGASGHGWVVIRCTR